MHFNNISKWLSKIGLCVMLCSTYFFAFNANASKLDWDLVNWPTGSLSQTYAIGGGNVTITFSGDTGTLTTVADGSPGSPEENNFQTGGLTPAEDSLFIRMDFPEGTPAVDEQSIVVTYTFSHPGGVRVPEFTVFDIDSGLDQWQDVAIASATRAGGAVVTPTSIVTGASNTSNGVDTATGTGGATDTSTDGNVTFLFDYNDITSFTFTYQNNAPNTAGSHNQWASMHDIVFNPPAVTNKVFAPSTISAGEVSTLTLTFDNGDPGLDATLTADFVDTMPAGTTIASPANIGGTCPGTANATPGGNTLTYTNGSQIPANSTCTITVDVTSGRPGTHTNTIPVGSLETDLGDQSALLSADLIVNTAAPTITKSFATDPIASGASSTMTLTLTNPNAAALTGATVTDTYPVEIVNATPANGASTCGGTVTAANGGTSVSLTGGTIPASGSCAVTVDVTSTTAGGPYTNTTGVVNTNEAPASATASDTLTVSSSSPPTISKSFSPSTINPGGSSQLTITLGNPNGSAITLSANMDDNLPPSVTAISVDNTATTCTDASVDISTSTRVRYVSGATIPAGGCDIVVNVTSNTLGVMANTIAAGALQTDVGNNANPASDNLTVNAGGGSPVCPAGSTLTNQTGNADAVESEIGIFVNATSSSANALGAPQGPGTITLANSAFVFPTTGELVLDMTDTVAEGSTIVLSLAQTGGNTAEISTSNDAIIFTAATTIAPSSVPLQNYNYTVAAGSGGARYIRIRDVVNGGWLATDAVSYSQICVSIPEADLTITKDDGNATYTPGGTATYTIVVTNNGPDDVTGATIADNLPNGVTMTAPWTCTPSSASSSCNTTPSTTDPISIDVDIIDGDSITVTIPVQFSSDMTDY